MVLQHPSRIPVADEGLPDVFGFQVLSCHIRTYFSGPLMQSLDHSKFVGQGMVRHEVKVAIRVGGIFEHSGRDGAIWFSLKQNIQK